MDNFKRCQKFISSAEGGANFDVINGKPVLKPKNKNDKGGFTKYGITIGALTKAYSQELVDHDDITKLTKPEADRIYEMNYWRPSHADKMPWGLCLIHYDCAVNCGVSGATKQLQRSLRELAESDVVRVDGVIGPASLAAIERVDWRELSRQYLNVREAYYTDIAAKNSSQKAFLKGWFNRLNQIKTEVNLDG